MGERQTQLETTLPAKIRFVTVQQLVKAGHSRTTIWRKVKAGELPKPFEWMGKLGWREGTLSRLMEQAEEKAG